MTAFYLFEEQIPVLEPFSLQYYQQYNTEWTSNRVAKINTERQSALLRSSKGVTATAKDSVPPALAPTALSSKSPANSRRALLAFRLPRPFPLFPLPCAPVTPP